MPNNFLLALKWAQLGPKGGQNEALGHFHVQNAFVFANFANYDREMCYLKNVVVEVLKKVLLALKWAQLGPKRGQNKVFGHFHVQSALVFANFANYDKDM